MRLRHWSNLIGAVLLCACSSETVEPLPERERVDWILTRVDGRPVPDTISECNPTCSARMVFADSLTIDETVAPTRFWWRVSSKAAGISEVERIVLTGTIDLVVLHADNHPVFPQSVPMGVLLPGDPSQFELQAAPPWRSRPGLHAFRFERLN